MQVDALFGIAFIALSVIAVVETIGLLFIFLNFRLVKRLIKTAGEK
jgi:uncharacterized membrane protein